MTRVTLTTDYVFYYFAGVMQSAPALIAAGKPAVIKGLPKDKELIYDWFMGTLGYFDVDLDGQASRLNWLPGKVSGQYLPTSVQNVNVYSGSKTATGRKPVKSDPDNADDMTNYAPFVFSTGGAFTMKNCVNYADITTNSYSSVFYGYYPLDAAGSCSFTDCVNRGTVMMRHAAMFFGNNTPFAPGGADNPFAFHTDPKQNRIQFERCKNEGKIRGTETANIFATRAADAPGGVDTISEAYETYLRESGAVPQDSFELIGKDLGMELYSDSEGNLTMKASEDPDVDHYRVSVYTYICVFSEDANHDLHLYGTTRYGAQERLERGNTAITLKKYGVCDYLDTEYVDSIKVASGNNIIDLDIVSKNDTLYYWLDNNKPVVGETYFGYVSGDRTPGGIAVPDIVTLAAYTAWIPCLERFLMFPNRLGENYNENVRTQKLEPVWRWCAVCLDVDGVASRDIISCFGRTNRPFLREKLKPEERLSSAI